MILLKPHQPARAEGCLIQTNATCVTGNRLAHALLCASVRVTTQRSAVVTRTKSEPKCVSQQTFPKTRSTAPGIMVSIAEYFFTVGNDNGKSLVYTSRTQKVLSVATACTVAIKAPPGRATGASAKAAIHLQNRAESKGLSILEKKNNPRVCSIQRAFVCFQLTISVPDDCLWQLFCRAQFPQLQDRPAYFKGGVYHQYTNARARASWMSCGYFFTEKSPRCL